MARRCGLRLAGLVLTFGLGMLFFEICQEAIFSLPDVPHSISLYSTTLAFMSCALLAAGSAASQAGAGRAVDLESPGPVSKAAANGAGKRLRIWLPYVALSGLQFAAGVAANHAVHYVDFTLKVVFKASKLLPTMLLSTLLGNSRAYSAREYSAAALLCLGTALFSFGSGKPGAGAEEATGLAYLLGVSLLVFATLADSYMPNVQQSLLRSGCSPDTLMLRVNSCGALGGVVGLKLSGDWRRMLDYVGEVPRVLPLNLAAALCFGLSVMSYTRLIEEAGSVFAVSVSTIRKTATVLLSFTLFPGKAFNSVRACGLLLVLLGMLLADSGRLALGRCRLLRLLAPKHGASAAEASTGGADV